MEDTREKYKILAEHRKNLSEGTKQDIDASTMRLIAGVRRRSFGEERLSAPEAVEVLYELGRFLNRFD